MIAVPTADSDGGAMVAKHGSNVILVTLVMVLVVSWTLNELPKDERVSHPSGGRLNMMKKAYSQKSFGPFVPPTGGGGLL
jgi:hypothetical protein